MEDNANGKRNLPAKRSFGALEIFEPVMKPERHEMARLSEGSETESTAPIGMAALPASSILKLPSLSRTTSRLLSPAPQGDMISYKVSPTSTSRFSNSTFDIQSDQSLKPITSNSYVQTLGSSSRLSSPVLTEEESIELMLFNASRNDSRRLSSLEEVTLESSPSISSLTRELVPSRQLRRVGKFTRLPILEPLLEESRGLKEFTLFMRLPFDLRRKIWALNLPGPRVVEVVENHWYDIDARDSIWSESYFEYHSSAERIVNLQICRESRKLALESYHFSFGSCHWQATIPFNFDIDTLFLGRRIQHPYDFRRHCYDKEKVMRLIVDRKLEWGQRNPLDRNDRLMYSNQFPIFPGVVEYTCLFTRNSEPLPIWAELDWFPRLDYMSSYERKAHTIVASRAAIGDLKDNWHTILMNRRKQLPTNVADEERYGGPDECEKYVGLREWKLPKVFSLGIEDNVIKAFKGPGQWSWASVLMDRAIEDLWD